MGGQRIHDRDAHAVEAARDLVAAAAELAARVEHRHNHFEGWTSGTGVNIDRNAITVVFDRHRPVRVDHHDDGVAAAGERFVYGVVDDFVYEMVESALVRAPDVHAGTTANCLQALQD